MATTKLYEIRDINRLIPFLIEYDPTNPFLVYRTGHSATEGPAFYSKRIDAYVYNAKIITLDIIGNLPASIRASVAHAFRNFDLDRAPMFILSVWVPQKFARCLVSGGIIDAEIKVPTKYLRIAM